MELLFYIFVLLILLFLIVLACVVFTNAVEHLGCRLGLAQSSIGCILAAIGTALPETILPLVAILGAYILHTEIEVGNEIGTGAILGSPLLLATLAYGLTGVAVYAYKKLNKRTGDITTDISALKRDIKYFLFLYALAISATFVPVYAFKIVIAMLLLGLYFSYVYRTICSNSVCDLCSDELDVLFISKLLGDKIYACLIQLFLGVLAIIILAHFFVETIKNVSTLINISPFILSMIIAPVATELPETFNSIIWIRSKKDNLALANISGAMVFQSSIPTTIGILLTPWVLDGIAFVSVGVVYLSILFLYTMIKVNQNTLKPWMLLINGSFYICYIIFLLLQTFP